MTDPVQGDQPQHAAPEPDENTTTQEEAPVVPTNEVPESDLVEPINFGVLPGSTEPDPNAEGDVSNVAPPEH